MAASKEARSNREALKKAGRERVPNLLMARLERQQARRTAAPFWPVWAVSILIFGLLAFLLRKNFKNGVILPVTLNSVPVNSVASPVPATSTQTVAMPAAAPVAEPSIGTVVALPQTADSGQPAAPGTPPTPAAPVQPPAAAPTPHASQWKGFYSPIKKYREVIIDSDSAWADLWKEMGQSGPAPVINFQESAVVGIFQGDSPQGSDVVLLEPHDYRRHVTIPYRLTTPAAGAAAGSSNATQPFHLKVIARSDKPIRFLQANEAAGLTPATTTQP